MYGFIADAIAVLHLVFVIFVVLGVLAVRRWPRIAWLHIPAVLWAAYVETTGSYCPLTPWETRYRELAGEHAYSGDFVGNYILPMLYPAGLTRGIQIALGLAVLAGNGLVYLLLARRQSHAPRRLERRTPECQACGRARPAVRGRPSAPRKRSVAAVLHGELTSGA